MSIWAHGMLGGQEDGCWVGECMGTCSAWAVQLLFPKAPSGSFRKLLESEKWGGSRIKNLCQNTYGIHLRAESKWCSLNLAEPLSPSLVTY